MKLRTSNLQCANMQVYEKPLSYILLRVFWLHFLKTHHDYFFRRGFESMRAQFLSGNISEKECYLVIYQDSIKIHLSQLSSCWIWHLSLSWVQFSSNKLEFFNSCNTKIFAHKKKKLFHKISVGINTEYFQSYRD